MGFNRRIPLTLNTPPTHNSNYTTMAATKKVIFVLSSHDTLGETGKPTGWYLPEAAHPAHEMAGKNVQITWVSPKGGKAPLDPSSVEASKDDQASQKFLKEEIAVTEKTEKLADHIGKSGDYDALFYVGGHGPMFDLAKDETSHALAYVKLSDGSYLIKDAEVTGFSNTEEDTVQLSKYMPFMLEDALKQNGGKYVKADQDWGEKVVVSGKDGKLITGQNPASAAAVGKAILKAIGA